MNEPQPTSPRYVEDGQGYPIVLLHPIAMRLEFWEPVAVRLARTNRVICVDLHGHGGNARAPEPYSIEDLAGEVITLVDRLKLESAVFVGCSLGGMVCQAIALKAPRIVSGLVLANTTHAMTEKSTAVMLQRAEASDKNLAGTVDADIERWFSPAFRATRPETVDTVRRWTLANDSRVVANGWRAIAGLDYEHAVAEIDCPVVVTTGSLDPASPPDAGLAMSRLFPRARFKEIPEAGHFSPLECPDAFAAIVRDAVTATGDR